MTKLAAPPVRHKFYAADGVTPLAGGKVYTYAAGTGFSTPLAVFQDQAGLSPHANPIILDASGEMVAYLAEARSYDWRWFTADNALVDDQIGITAASGDAGSIGFLASGGVARTSDSKLSDVVSLKDFGAVPDGLTDNTTALQLAIDTLMSGTGGTLVVPRGHYKVFSPVFIDRSLDSSRKRLSIVGESQADTWIESTGSGSLFVIKNNHTLAGEQSASYQRFANMLVTGQAQTGTAVSVNLAAFIDFADLNIQGFEYGIDAIDVDHAMFNRVKTRFNRKGVRMRKSASPGTASTQPNNISLLSCNLSNNVDYGGLFEGGACINFYGGSVENNGAVGAGGYGLKFKDCGYEGAIGANIDGTYFESNNGIADLILEGIAAGGLTQSVHHVKASFNRASATSIATNNILCTFGDPSVFSLQKLVLMSSFKSLGAYTPNAGRPYVAFNGFPANKDSFYDVGSLYEDAVERPAFVQNLNKRYAKLTKAAAQTYTTGAQAVWLLDTNTANYSWTPAIAAGIVNVDEPGFYAIDALIGFSSAAAGLKKVLIFNGATLIGYGEGSQDIVAASCAERFAAGDALSIQVVQSTGGNLDVVASLSKLCVSKTFD